MTRAVGAVVLARTVGVEQADDDGLGAVLGGRVAHLHLVHPLGHGVVVELLDLVLIHHVLDHQVRPVAVHLGGREVDQPKPQTLLQADHVLRADGVGLPQPLVEVLAVPPAELSGAVIHIVERPHSLEDALDLPELADVAARVERRRHVGPDAEAHLVRLVVEVAGDDLVAAAPQLRDEPGSNRSHAAGNQDTLRHFLPRFRHLCRHPSVRLNTASSRLMPLERPARRSAQSRGNAAAAASAPTAGRARSGVMRTIFWIILQARNIASSPG